MDLSRLGHPGRSFHHIAASSCNPPNNWKPGATWGFQFPARALILRMTLSFVYLFMLGVVMSFGLG